MRYPLILSFLLSIFSGYGQNPEWVNCLSGEQVHNCVEDETILWMATSGGLVAKNKLDGTNRYYNCANSDLQTNELSQVLVDINNVIWIPNVGVTSIENDTWVNYPDVSGGMALNENGHLIVANSAGIHKWNGSAFDFIPYSVDVGNLIVNDVIVNKINGDVWISLNTFGIFQIAVYRNEDWEIYNSSNSNLPWESSSGNQFSFDNENNLWLSTYYGVYQYDGVWKDMNNYFDLLNERTVDIAHDGLANTYVLTRNNEEPILKLDKDSVLTVIEYPDEFDGDIYPHFISASEDGEHLKMGSARYGLWEYSHSHWTKIKSSANIFTNNRFNIKKSPKGKIYLSSGTASSKSQLLSYQNQEWTDVQNQFPFNLKPENSEGYTLNFYGELNFGYYMHFLNKLYKSDANEWLAVDFPDIDPNTNENNSEIFVDEFSNTWLFNKSNAYIFREKDSLWHTYLPSIHGATSGTWYAYFNHPVTSDLWLSTNIGLSVYSYTTDTWQRFNFKDFGLSSRDAFLQVDDKGIIWGHNTKEFFRMNNLTDIEILKDLTVIGDGYNRYRVMLLEDDKLVLGMDNGIMFYENNEFQTFDTTNSGISNGRVNSFVRDINNNLYISADGGLSIYNKEGVTADIITKPGINSTSTTEENKTSYNVYPNPATIQLNIKSKEHNSEFSYQLINCSGQQLKNGKALLGMKTIDLFDIPKGLYFLKVDGEQKNSSSIVKVIID